MSAAQSIMLHLQDLLREGSLVHLLRADYPVMT